MALFLTVRRKKGWSIPLSTYLLNTRISDNIEGDLQKHLALVCFKPPIYRSHSHCDFEKNHGQKAKQNIILACLFFFFFFLNMWQNCRRLKGCC